MLKIEDACDLNGRALQRGDTVTTVGGGTTGKIKDIVDDDGALFVELRPLHRASGKGVWHAADRLLFLSAANGKKTSSTTDQNIPKAPKRKK